MMSSQSVVHCASDIKGNLWRVQCDPATKVCLYALNNELDSDRDRWFNPTEAKEYGFIDHVISHQGDVTKGKA